jgi:hypothetical protein
MKIQLGVRVEPTLKAALEKAARKEKRSLNAQVETILEQWIGQQKRALAKSGVE